MLVKMLLRCGRAVVSTVQACLLGWQVGHHASCSHILSLIVVVSKLLYNSCKYPAHTRN